MFIVIGMGNMKGTGLEAVFAAGAYLFIDINCALLTSFYSIGRADGHAARITAVVTLVRKKVPPHGAICFIFDEFDPLPGRS